MTERLSRNLLEALVILAVGVLVGLSAHHRLLLDVFAGRVATPLPTAASEGPLPLPVPVDLAGVRAALQKGALAVDARLPERYREGHLPGARSLPWAEVEEGLPAFLAQVPKERRLILYCSGYGCPDSFDLGVRLLAAGYRDVLVFEGGFPAWQDAGLAVTAGAEP
jgi:rhodanese-related sulfurtransferase